MLSPRRFTLVLLAFLLLGLGIPCLIPTSIRALDTTHDPLPLPRISMQDAIIVEEPEDLVRVAAGAWGAHSLDVGKLCHLWCVE